MYRSSVPASSTPLRPGRTCNTQESLGAAGVAARGVEDWRRVGGGDWRLMRGGEIRVAGRPRLAPTCGEVCARHSTEQMRARSPVIFHIFFVLNKTKTMRAESS